MQQSLCNIFASEIRNLFATAALDATACCAVPLQWRGGKAVLIPKGRGAARAPLTAFRDIWLHESPAKAISAALRTRCLPYVHAG